EGSAAPHDVGGGHLRGVREPHDPAGHDLERHLHNNREPTAATVPPRARGGSASSDAGDRRWHARSGSVPWVHDPLRPANRERRRLVTQCGYLAARGDRAGHAPCRRRVLTALMPPCGALSSTSSSGRTRSTPATSWSGVWR